MDQIDSIMQDINEPKLATVLSISSNSSICSDFCGFNQPSAELTLEHRSKYFNKHFKEMEAETISDGVKGKGARDFKKSARPVARNEEAEKRYFANEMKLLPAEEVFEVNSNSTTDTLKRQRMARNKDLRLKETYLISRNPIKKHPTGVIFPKARVEDNSETSSEFPASSPSNTQLQIKTQQSQRPPMLKNTLPADAFERSLALIAVQNPPMTVTEKISAWKCANIDELSDVEDVVSFDKMFNARELNPKRLPTRSKTATGGTYNNFTEFQRRISSIRAPEASLRGSDSKQKSKFTSEDDEKPTTSNCNARTRETPLKKRATKYKRAAIDPHNDTHIPKKKSSSSGTQKNETKIAKRKPQPQNMSAAIAAGDNAMKLCNESSVTSSHAQIKDNSKSSSLRNLSQAKTNQSNILESKALSSKLCQKIGLKPKPKKEDSEAFFRWRRLSREIDKTNQIKIITTSPPKPSAGLIQIRYDFMDSNKSKEQPHETIKPNSYNVVVKTLSNKKAQKTNENNEQLIFKSPLETQKFKQTKSKSITKTKTTTIQAETSTNKELKEKTEIIVKELKHFAKFNNNNNNNNGDGNCNNKSPNNKYLENSSVEFHQQHEFCNYLGLTGMSTANAMATAAAELSKYNIARRSLRVRQIEKLKAKDCKRPATPKKKENVLTKSSPESSNNDEKCSDELVEKMQKSRQTDLSKTMETNSPTICAESLDTNSMQANGDMCIKALTPSEQMMQQTKEKEAKIQILCQITASSKEEEEEACKKCVEQITEPIRRTLLEQCKQSGDGPKATPIVSMIKLDPNATKRILSESILSENDATKFLELTPKLAESEPNVEKAEIQTLHEKVQKCLKEARQNPPNIFIVKSLDNLKAQSVETMEEEATEEQQSEEPKIVLMETDETAQCDEELFEEDLEIEEKVDLPLLSLRSKATLRNHKATQVSTAETAKDNKKRKPPPSRTVIRKTNSNLSGTRRLYTRSMLNLNQQRELRNRKVILKLLKTYSGLRIKVSQAKKKTNSKLTDESIAVVNKKKKQKQNLQLHHQDHETSIELAVTSEDTVGDTKSAPVQTLYVNKLSESCSINSIRNNSSNEELISVNDDDDDSPVVDTTIEMPVKGATTFETKAVFEYEDLYVVDSENVVAATSSRTLTPKHICYSEATEPLTMEDFKPMNFKENSTDAAVQTDLANVTTIFQPFIFGGNMINSSTAAAPPPQPPPPPVDNRENNDIDVVSSSDVVTSTTCHIGLDQNRNAAQNPISNSNLITKELYRNFSFTAESNAAADAAHSEISAASNIFTEMMNPLANVSLDSSAANINDLGIHTLSEPSRALRNPLKMSDGPVLYMYYEEGLLIVVQAALVSFWKYMRILNALTVNPHETKCVTSLNSRDIGTEELQSSAATMDFRSSDLEHMSSMLVSGCEWFYMGERNRLSNDIEIESPYMNRLCFNDSRPVYVEMRCRELLNDFRECNLLSCYVNVYFFNEEEQVPCFHSIQLDSIQSAPTDVIYTTIFDSRYFVLAWPQANVLGKVRSGVCKYALTPELDMLATTRDFKAMRHALRSLECLKDGKLLGFGDSQLTVWDHRSGDVLMNYDLSMPLGRNLGTIYYQGVEAGQDNVVIMLQHVRSEASSDLVVIACTISHSNPSRRVLQRHRLPTPAFYNIRRGVNNGEHFVITSNSDEEIWINCNDPRQLIFIPAQRSQRFYSSNRSTLVELTNQTLTVDSFSNYLLKIAAGINSSKNKIVQTANSSRGWC